MTARKTPADTFVRDSAIWDSMTRWIVLHGTQGVKLERNVGYKSIGHGFYLEDGTETDNSLTANLGIFARAAVDNAQNPRKVPGILAAPNLNGNAGENVPYRSDYDHPTVFWTINGWNDFRDNMAAGAGTCGVCYWLVPGYNGAMSREQRWESYASMQDGLPRAGTTPLRTFAGNSCTAAMTSFQTVGSTAACAGVGPDLPPFPTLHPVLNPLAGNVGDDEYYPEVSPDGSRLPTQCNDADCSTIKTCRAEDESRCMVTVLDHYTTSFNWAQFNFAAIWLRAQWYLVTDSVITDVQQAGLSMVTGGGYTDSDVIPGRFGLVRKSVFIGNTQDCESQYPQGFNLPCDIRNNPFASNGGPFNPGGLHCALTTETPPNRPAAYCLSIAEGVSHPVSNFGMYQRLFSLYDGPAFQESNAYLNIKERKIDDCGPWFDTNDPKTSGR